MRKWEYKAEVIVMDAAPAVLEKRLNELGTEGWELAQGHRIFRSSQSKVACVFKRPMEEPEGKVKK